VRLHSQPSVCRNLLGTNLLKHENVEIDAAVWIQVDEIMIPMFTWAIQPIRALGDPVEFERLHPAEAAEWQRNLQVDFPHR
jgi:hypothetical protein